MERKSFHVKGFKEVDGEAGVCEFIASVFDNVDDGKDVVEKGAFAKVIESQPRPPKFVPDHNWSVLLKLGKHLEWKETDGGLWCKSQFNLDKEVARDVYSDFKFAPEEVEFSFSYDIAEGGFEVKDGVRYIKEFSAVYDVGPVGIGMNRETGLIDVKSALGLLGGDRHFGSLAGLKLQDHSQMVLAAVGEYNKRLEDLLSIRAKESRTLSAASLADIDAAIDAASTILKRLKALKERAAPKGDDDEGKTALTVQFEHEFARFQGV